MAGVRLKEQDAVIELLRVRTAAYFEEAGASAGGGAGGGSAAACERAFAEVEALLAAHCSAGAAGAATSELARLCPGVGRVFVPLDLLGALRAYDDAFHITARRHVLPSFKEVREVLNLATVGALGGVRLVTLDADDTIYEDGGVLSASSPMIVIIARLLALGVCVSLVTAASYPGHPERYEARLAGLLQALAFAIECGAPAEPLLGRFFVMGGQCNQLLRARCRAERDGAHPRVVLEEMAPEAWKPHRGVRWDHGAVSRLLDVAQAELEERARALRLEVSVIRKERAVGVIAAATPSAASRLTYEVLEELALAVQARLGAAPAPGEADFPPFCAFNGGHDVFVDVGNKALGVRTLQGLLGVPSEETVHVGDRFTRTGNDEKTRSVANTLWVAGPHETEYLLALLTARAREHRRRLSPQHEPASPMRGLGIYGAAAATAADAGAGTGAGTGAGAGLGYGDLSVNFGDASSAAVHGGAGAADASAFASFASPARPAGGGAAGALPSPSPVPAPAPPPALSPPAVLAPLLLSRLGAEGGGGGGGARA